MNFIQDYHDRLGALIEKCKHGQTTILSRSDKSIIDLLPVDMRASVVVLDTGDIIVTKKARSFSGLTAIMRRLEMRELNVSLIQVENEAEIANFASMREGEVKVSDDNEAQKSIIRLIQAGVDNKASDIHIDVEETRVKIQYRIDGDLVPAEKISSAFTGFTKQHGESMLRATYESMTDIKDSEYMEYFQQDARMDRKFLPHSLYGVRIARSPQLTGQYMCLRLLYDGGASNENLTHLGYTSDQIDTIRLMLAKPTGFVVIGGGTGSGKSTTLKNMLATLYRETKGKRNIITVEDPPEYPIAGARQVPVSNASTDDEREAAFIKAIRFMLRADPDVCMIGEIRDLPSANLALQAAMTGHLVFSTLHVNNVHMIMPRLQQMGIQPDMMADESVITGMICQSLVKKLCPECKQRLLDMPRTEFTDTLMKRLSMSGIELDNVFIASEKGCPHCKHTGNKGRSVVAEVLIPDETYMRLFLEGQRFDLADHTKSMGYLSMVDHAKKKVASGLVSPLDAEDVVGPLGMVAFTEDSNLAMREIQQIIREGHYVESEPHTH